MPNRSKEAEENAADCLRRMEAFSSQLEQKTGQLAAATEDLEVRKHVERFETSIFCLVPIIG